MLIQVIKCILLIILGAALEISLGWVRSDLGLSYSMLTGFALFFLVGYLSLRLIKSLKRIIILTCLFLGISSLQIPVRVYDFNGTLVSLPDYVFHVLGLLTAGLFHQIKNRKKWLVAGIGFGLVLVMYFKGYNMWIHRLNFDGYTGSYFARMPEFIAFDRKENRLSRDGMINKITLIDFWHTRCGACFRKFPVLNEAYLNYRLSPKVQFMALNLPLATDRPGQAFDMIQRRGYSFPVAKLHTPSLIDSLSISSFPTTILVNENGEVVFKGSIENGIARLEREIKKPAR